MGAQVGSKGAFSDINMTPLIDIVLVVLIIMMVSVPIETETLGIRVPPKQTEPPPPPDPNAEQLVISLYEDGSKALNRRVMADQEMFYEITRRLKPMMKKIVFIDSAGTTLFGPVVDVIDLAKEAGAETVAFAKLKEAGPLPATSVSPGSIPRGVTAGSPSTTEHLTEKKAYGALEPKLGLINGCYTQALATNPTLSGRMILQLGLWPKGEIVSNEIVGSTVENKELEACIQQVGAQLVFEPLGDDKTATVGYPLLFSPG